MTYKLTTFITLGSGNEFGLSGDDLFLRNVNNEYHEEQKSIDLGPATKENFQNLIDNMKRLECHMAD